MMEFIATHAGLLGLTVFFFFFVAVTLWTYRPAARKMYRDCGLLPFREDK
jgi:cbb3-type cytochrome oxidase subunit 3